MKSSRSAIIATSVVLIGAAAAIAGYVRMSSPEQSVTAARAEDISPLRAGDKAPVFTVRTVENEAFLFDPDGLEKPTVLIAVRGGWCPYCNTQLSELRHVVPELKEKGFDVLFLSNDSPDRIYDGLKDETKESIDALDYTILSDADASAARAFGTAFKVADEYVRKLDERGHNYADSSLERYQVLAVPSVYLVDSNGDIVFAYANPNYKVRLPPAVLMDAANQLMGE